MKQANREAQQRIDAQIALLESELLELKRQRNELSPVSTIPSEVLCQILSLATTREQPDDFGAPLEKLREDRCIETLCHVSRVWRLCSLGCPSLWAEIDIGMTTDPRRVEFMLQNARPHPISVLIDEDLVGHRAGQSLSAEAAVLALSGGDSVNNLGVKGSIGFMSSLLKNAQPRPLLALRLSASNTGGFVNHWPDQSIAQNLLIPPETGVSKLRQLSIRGFTIPFASPIITRSPHITSLSLTIPPGCDISHILDMFKNVVLIQRLDLVFLEPLRPSQAALNPARLPYLWQLVFNGESTAAISTLAHLRLPVMNLSINLILQLRGDLSAQQEGANVFRAVGKARCPPPGVQTTTQAELFFSPQVIAIGRFCSNLEGVISTTLGNWLPPEDDLPDVTVDDLSNQPSATVSVVFRNHETLSVINWADWYPLVAGSNPEELRELTGWSMDALQTFGIFDGADYPDSLWHFVSKCSSITELSVDACQMPQLLALLSTDNAAFPLPSLDALEVGRPPEASVFAGGLPPVDTEYSTLFEPLFRALGSRQAIHRKYGIRKEWVLDQLSVINYPFEGPIQHYAQYAHNNGLIREVIY
ncbi:hypothetical protein NMY22_g7732 [Coprinellus aureogranulatus]|nr:hypothetical protein NMY22_g7732 [Coprinellus aureogranulatus]